MAKEKRISILLLLRDRLTKPISASGRALRTFRNNARLLNQTLGPLTSRVAGLAAAFAGVQTVRKALQLARVQVQAQAQLASALRGNVDLFNSITQAASDFQAVTTVGDEEFIKQAATLAISLRETSFEMSRLGEVTATTFQVAAATGRTAQRVMRQLVETITLGRVSEEITKFFPQLAQLDEDALRAGGAFDLLAESLGGTAEALAATDFGRVTQQGNLLGDIFERLGVVFVEIQADIMPKLVAVFDEFAQAAETDTFKGTLALFSELAVKLVELLPLLTKVAVAFVAIKTAAFAISVVTGIFVAIGSAVTLLATGGVAGALGLALILTVIVALVVGADNLKEAFNGLVEIFGSTALTASEKFGLLADELAILLLLPLRLGESFLAFGKVVVFVFTKLIAESILFATTVGSEVAKGIRAALREIAVAFDQFTAGLAISLNFLSAGAGEAVRTNLVANLDLAVASAEHLKTAATLASAAAQIALDRSLSELTAANDALSTESRRADADRLRDRRQAEINARLNKEADAERATARTKSEVERAKGLKREKDLIIQLIAIEENANREAQARITAQTLAALQDRHNRGLVLGSALVAERIKLELEPLQRSIDLAISKRDEIRAVMDSFAEGDAKRVEALTRLVAAERTLQKLQLDRVDVLRTLGNARRQAAEGSVAQVRSAAAELAGEQRRLEQAAGLGGISIGAAAESQAAAVARFQEQVNLARREVSLLLGSPEYAADAQRLLAVLTQIEIDGLGALTTAAEATGEGISAAISGSASPALSGFFQGVIDGTANATEAFTGFLNSVLRAVSDFIAQSVVQDFLTLLSGAGAGGLLFGAGGLLGAGAGGGLFGALGGGAAAAVPAAAGVLEAGADTAEAGVEGANTIALATNTTALGALGTAMAALATGIVSGVTGIGTIVTAAGGVITAAATAVTTASTALVTTGILPLIVAIDANTVALGVSTVTPFATGGLVPGPRVAADIVPARLTPGEWVIRQRAAAYYGHGILEAMNRRLVPRELFDKFRANVSMVAPVGMLQGGGAVQAAGSVSAGGIIAAVVVADDGTMDRLLAGGENALLRFVEDHAPRIASLIDRHRGMP